MNHTATADYRSHIAYLVALLCITFLGVTLALLFANRFTAARIEQAVLHDRLVGLAQVLPPTVYDNDPIREAITIDDANLGSEPTLVYPARKGGTLTAVAFQVARPGYGGPITLLMAVDANGEILGVRTVSHKETPGLADRIEISKDDWIKGFDGRSLRNTTAAQWRVKKDGGEFDQFTGATITPRAVVNAVYTGLHFQQRHFIETTEHSAPVITQPAAAQGVISDE